MKRARPRPRGGVEGAAFRTRHQERPRTANNLVTVLPQQLQAELHLSRRTSRRDAAEVGIRHGAGRIQELSVIEGIEGLRAELKVHRFPYRE